jgi:hypothetical protein
VEGSVDLDVLGEAGLVERVAQLAGDHGRIDLAAELARTAFHAGSQRVIVFVVGEHGHGKSSLVNALATAEVSPVDDTATAVPIAVRWAKAAAITVHHPDREGRPASRMLEPAALRDWATEQGNPGNVRNARVVEVAVPLPALSAGVVLVDTPGIAGLGSLHAAVTAASLPAADAVIVVSDGGHELTSRELEFVRGALAVGPQVCVVKSRVDIHPAWRATAARDEAHLRDARADVPVFGASAALAREALVRRDARMDADSGIGAVLDWLEQVVGAIRARVPDVGAVALGSAATLTRQLERERVAIDAAAENDGTAAALDRARIDVERARDGARRSVRTVGEQFVDLAAELDEDLRVRWRRLSKSAAEQIDGLDPARSWGEFERWLRDEVGAASASHGQLVQQRVEAIVGAGLADLYGSQPNPGGIPRLTATTIDASLHEAAAGSTLQADDVGRRKATPVGQVLTIARSSYGGLAMVGFFGAMTGVVLAAPVMLGLGVVLGGKGARDERGRQLAARRAHANQVVHRYLDDVSRTLANGRRDHVRRVQRQLRDDLVQLGAEREEAALAAYESLRRSVAADHADRARRRAEVDRDLAELAAIRHRLVAFVAELDVHDPVATPA